ncbi:ftsH [Symbiodinium microadriaticum]|nr:ftsH [Symbiodinium microadriaticum]
MVILGLVLMFNLFQGAGGSGRAAEVPFSDFVAAVERGEVSDVLIQGETIKGHYNDGRSFATYAPDDPTLVQRLNERGVTIQAAPPEDGMPTILGILISWFPMLLLIGVWVYMMRQMQGGGKGAMGFGKSRAKLLTERHGRVTFDDVAGVDEAKEELEEIVEFLSDPQKFQRLGGKIPKGALLVGPPGTGKTLLARAIAGEANVPFFTISGSDFVEMFVGVGASRVRDMFEQAKKNAPCIIFIDEIDAVGRHRGAGLGGGNDEREQTLNQLLVEMDGFEATDGVILIAATNRPDVLDPALLRPGRFDRQVVVPNPDIIGREKILKVHMQKVPLAPDVEARTIARGTPGFSGADLANLVNEAALLAARIGKRLVTMADFEAAKDKVMMGAERRSMVMSEDEKKLTAYHEAGHALVALHCAHSDPIHKATIIPRGRALGMVMRLPERDQLSMSKAKMFDDMAVAMGGRIAEELIFGKELVTSGASSDLEQATRMARAMVTRFGMSDKLGPMAYGENEEEVFLGHSVARTQNISEQTAREIDTEIKKILEDSYETATGILTDHMDDLHKLAQGLLEYETLSGDEISNLLAGKSPTRDDGDSGGSGIGSAVPTAGRKPSGNPGGLSAAQAVAHGLQLAADGADILDIGGESTRPGADPVSRQEELDRVIPVIEGLRVETDLPLSIDTRHAAVMTEALKAGADIINDVSALTGEGSLAVAAGCDAAIILMHMQGQPQTMQDDPSYQNVVADVKAWLADRVAACADAGIAKDRLVLDPGIGFGKTLSHNLDLLANLSDLKSLGCPVLLGASRKRFIAGIHRDGPADERVGGSVAAVLAALDRGINLFRVHDVKETAEAIAVWQAIRDTASKG